MAETSSMRIPDSDLAGLLQHDFLLESAELVKGWPQRETLSTDCHNWGRRRLIYRAANGFVLVKEKPGYLTLENWIGPRVHALAWESGMSVSEPLIGRDGPIAVHTDAGGRSSAFSAQRLVEGSIWKGNSQHLAALAKAVAQLSWFFEELGSTPAVGGRMETIGARASRFIAMAQSAKPADVEQRDWERLFRAMRQRIDDAPVSPPHLLLHGDINPTNAVFDASGNCQIFDFDDSRWGSALVDVASLALFTSFLEVDPVTKELVSWSRKPNRSSFSITSIAYSDAGHSIDMSQFLPALFANSAYVFSVMARRGYINRPISYDIIRFFEELSDEDF